LSPEEQRLNALHQLQILDTDPEHEFDSVTSLAAMISHSPIALVSFIDAHRQWFKSRVGFEESETSRERSLCNEALQYDNMLEVEDVHNDPRFTNHPIKTYNPEIRFYAGLPIRTAEGYPVGTLCVADKVPRSLTVEERTALNTLASHIQQHVRMIEVEREFERRFHELRQQSTTQEQRYSMAVTLLSIVAHDVRGPLATIVALLESAPTPQDLGDDLGWILNEIHHQAQSARNLLDQVLSWARMVLNGNVVQQPISIGTFIADIVRPLQSTFTRKGIVFDTDLAVQSIVADPNLVRFVLHTLLTNATKFTDNGAISVRVHCSDEYTTLVVHDTQREQLFDWKWHRGKQGTREETGAGIGLLLLHDVVQAANGTISVQSEEMHGTTFTICLPQRRESV
jgi:signal transduction histidine kinase